jgi:hypothetical protein
MDPRRLKPLLWALPALLLGLAAGLLLRPQQSGSSAAAANPQALADAALLALRDQGASLPTAPATLRWRRRGTPSSASPHRRP